MNDRTTDRIAFEEWCKRDCSPGAQYAEWYWRIFQAGIAHGRSTPEPGVDVAALNRELCITDGHVLGVVARPCLRCHEWFDPQYGRSMNEPRAHALLRQARPWIVAASRETAGGSAEKSTTRALLASELAAAIDGCLSETKDGAA